MSEELDIKIGSPGKVVLCEMGSLRKGAEGLTLLWAVRRKGLAPEEVILILSVAGDLDVGDSCRVPCQGGGGDGYVGTLLLQLSIGPAQQSAKGGHQSQKQSQSAFHPSPSSLPVSWSRA